MTDRQDDFEAKVQRKIREYVTQGVGQVDIRAAADRAIAGSDRPTKSIGALAGATSAVALAFVIGLAVVLRGNPPPAASRGDSSTPRQTHVVIANSSSPPPSQVVPTGLPTASPHTAGMTERERSDFFWGAITDFGPYSYTFDSLAHITQQVHLIVRGRVIGVEPSELVDYGPFVDAHERVPAVGIVRIDEVLKGEPSTETPGMIRVAALAFADLSEEDLPRGEVLLFLFNYAQIGAEDAFNPPGGMGDGYHYVRPNRYQCVLRSIDGIVEIVDGPRGSEEALGPFPWILDGQPFSEVVERVRAIVARNG